MLYIFNICCPLSRLTAALFIAIAVINIPFYTMKISSFLYRTATSTEF